MFKVRCWLVMYSIIVMANAAPLNIDSEAKILSNSYSIDEKGNYEFSFKTSNGIARYETGSIFNEGQPNQYILVTGRYTFLNKEGEEQIVEYIAGDEGYIISPPKPEIMQTVLALPGQVVATLLG